MCSSTRTDTLFWEPLEKRKGQMMRAVEPRAFCGGNPSRHNWTLCSFGKPRTLGADVNIRELYLTEMDEYTKGKMSTRPTQPVNCEPKFCCSLYKELRLINGCRWNMKPKHQTNKSRDITLIYPFEEKFPPPSSNLSDKVGQRGITLHARVLSSTTTTTIIIIIIQSNKGQIRNGTKFDWKALLKEWHCEMGPMEQPLQKCEPSLNSV